ncbi:class I SAM-dependent methyltransferase [Mariprofundus sp. EBB-1]|uniref:methyltransferase n=1 Tax=Mariprofundus sp. EBB-1 TaxID=2650971 RepID=UPI000EF23A49|nr:methyltransferase [Mariprofundus sp. EBB-1]RLL54357.1 class I SAM-dependent methyltransferase [Mariprofundus sp. EBB-1]
MSAIDLLYHAALNRPSAPTLIINAHAHALLLQLSEKCQQLDLHQHFKPEHTAIHQLGLNVSPTLPALDETYDTIFLLPSKNKQQTLAWMAQAMQSLDANGTLLIACANNHGAKSYESALQSLAGNTLSRSKSKCRIFSAKKTASLDSALLAQWLRAGEVRTIPSHGLIAQPGLFSWDHADIGSQLLIDHLPDNLSGTGMDLCCGYGLLSEHLLRTTPQVDRLHLVEADRLALDCAIQNTTVWQQKTQSHWLDATHDALPEKLAWIVCNPPFHTAQQRDVELGKNIVKRGCQQLKRGGSIYVVANRKLAYETLMQAELRACQTIIEANGFKIIKGIR